MEFAEQLLAVALVFALLGGGLWVLRRRGMVQGIPFRNSRQDGLRLESIDRLALGPHHSLHLVRVANRTLLIGLSPQSCTVLDHPLSSDTVTPGLAPK